MRRIYAWRESVRIDAAKEVINSQLPADAEQVEPGVYTYATSLWRGLFSLEYRWEIKLEDRSYHVSEHAHLSAWWLIGLAISAVGFPATFTLFESSGPVWMPIYSFATILLLIGFFFLVMIFMSCESPLRDLFRANSSLGLESPVFTLILAVLPVSLMAILFTGWLRLLAIAGVAALFVGYRLFHDSVKSVSLKWQSVLKESSRKLPSIASTYTVFMVMGMIPPLVFFIIHDDLAFAEGVAAAPFLSVFLYSSVFLVDLEASRRVLVKARKQTEASFTEQGRTLSHRIALAASSLVVVTVSVALGILSYVFVESAIEFTDLADSVAAYGIVIVSGIPLVYVVGGLSYQITSYAVINGRLLWNSTPQDFDHLFETDASIRVVDSERIYAGSFTTGFTDYILISEPVIENLDDGELAALLAHEEAHFEHGDALLSTLIPVLSPLIFTGKNVLYGTLDFRQREFQADQYAAQQINDPQQLVDALDAFQELLNERGAEEMAAAGPNLVALDEANTKGAFFERLFGYFYGNFALTQIHPSFQTRKQRLQDNL